LTQYKIPARYIELEITETSLIDANHKSIRTLEEIRALDIELALDDFGTGYTAFNQLIHYPVNCLKIDKSFIDNLSEQNETQITMLNAIAKAFKLKTVAEGIETKQQLDLIQKYGCDMAQGYLLCKSIEFSQFIEVLHNSK
jgi:EAL domain-containing protein (putative c-di-GMP-specific phosphodiesterase class I)